MKARNLFLSQILLGPILAWAGISNGVGTGHAGNGGDIVHCESGQPFKAKLLDLYEASFFDDGYQLDLDGTSVAEKSQHFIEKLRKFSPVRADEYKASLDQFMDKVFWVKDGELTDIPDSDHLVIPVGCELNQIAIQLPDDVIAGKKYMINRDLWNLLDSDSQTALIFHEIIYTEALREGHQNSRQVRKFNALIASREFSEFTQAQFNQVLEQIGFPNYQPVANYPNLYIEPFQSKGWRVVKDSTIEIVNDQSVSLPVDTKVYFDEDSGFIKYVYFSEDSSVGLDLVLDGIHFLKRAEDKSYQFARIEFNEGTDVPLGIRCHNWEEVTGVVSTYPSKHGEIQFNLCNVSFFPNGKVRSLGLDEAQLVVDPRLSLDPLFLEKGSHVYFHDNGAIQSLKIARPARFSAGGRTYTGNPDQTIEFGPEMGIRELKTSDPDSIDFLGRTYPVSDHLLFDRYGRLVGGKLSVRATYEFYGYTLNIYKGTYIVNESPDVRWKDGIHGFGRNKKYSFKIDGQSFECWSEDLDVTGNGHLSCSDFIDFEGAFFGEKVNVGKAYDGYIIEFYDNGKVRWFDAEELGQVFHPIIRGRKYTIGSQFSFHPNGQVSNFVVHEDSIFEKRDGSFELVRAYDGVKVDEEGYLQEVFRNN